MGVHVFFITYWRVRRRMPSQTFLIPLLLLLFSTLVHCEPLDDAAELDTNITNPINTNSLHVSESGGGKSNGTPDDSEERKTLSQQVADGKYGLIQRELFSGGVPTAPGVLSYSKNPEIPKDNSDNLGGLNKEEIWLAEDHLLVLRGGKFEEDDGAFPISAPVSAIDDYQAPLRQVKIPSKPKIPPPFPVQLQDDGPIQILEASNTADSKDETSQSDSGHRNPSHALTGGVKNYNVGKPSENFGSGAVRGQKQPPIGPAGPLDEDDHSIYYPPPYSFYYPKDNSSLVPPGPLVPGIVLPPPPNFFGVLHPPSTTIMPPHKPATTYRPKVSTTISTTTQKPIKSTTPKPYLPPIVVKTTPAPYLQSIEVTTPTPQVFSQAPRPVYVEYFETNKIQPPSRIPQNSGFKPPQRYEPINEVRPQIQQINEVRPQIQQINEVRPQIQSVSQQEEQIPQINQAPVQQIVEQLPQAPIRTYISSTAVPLRAFFKNPQRPAQIYYYEEDPSLNEVPQTPKNPPRFYIATVSRPKPQINLNNFDFHIQQIRNQLGRVPTRQSRYQNQNKRYRQPRPVYQYSFGYDKEVKPTPPPPRFVQITPPINNHYRPQLHQDIITPSPIDSFRPITPNYRRPIEDTPALQIVTPNPINDFQPIRNRPEVTPNPIYQQYYEDITNKNNNYYFGQKVTTPLPLLQNDINVNYRRPLPPQNPQAEFFADVNANIRQPTSEGGPGTFISYRLPGDGAHFYFLTPQLARDDGRQRSDGENGYFYPNPQQRLRRRS